MRQSPPYKDICFFTSSTFCPSPLAIFSSSPEGYRCCRTTGEGKASCGCTALLLAEAGSQSEALVAKEEARDGRWSLGEGGAKKKPNGIQTPVQLCAPGCDGGGGGVAESCSSAGEVFSPLGSSLICRLRRRLRGGSGGGLAGASLLCHLHPCLLTCRCCGEGGGSFGGSTMAAAGRGDSSFKVDTCPCLREGEFPSRDAKAACSPSPPAYSRPKTRTGCGSTPPHPPPAVAQ